MTTLSATRLTRPGQATLLGFLCLATLGTSHAEAKQCIWNKAGFVMNISWVKDKQVVRTDQISTLQGSCLDDDYQHTVILSVVGGEIAEGAYKGAIFAATAALGAAIGVVTEGPGGAVGGAGFGALSGEVLASTIPSPRDIFYTGVPDQDRYLDVWGTLWDPQTGPGGPI